MKKFIPSLLLIPILMACSGKPFELVSRVFTSFGFTPFNVKIYNGQTKDLDEIENLVSYYNELCDFYYESDKYVNVAAINSASEPIVVEDALYDLLKKSVSYQQITMGYFNPLMGDLSQLWKDSLAKKQVPSETDIQTKLAAVNNSQLILNDENKSVQIIGDAKLDLGAVAKGYLLDIIKDQLDEKELPFYLIDCGSSSIALGRKPQYLDFSVGIKDLNNAYFKAHDVFVSTSSLYEQGVTVNNITYSHIVNPFTGNALTNYDLVLIKGDKCESGLMDALTTAMSCMDIEQIKQYAARYELDYLLVNDHQLVAKSIGMEVLYH